MDDERFSVLCTEGHWLGGPPHQDGYCLVKSASLAAIFPSRSEAERVAKLVGGLHYEIIRLP